MSTTKACKNHFQVPLRTTKLAQSTPQYYFVLQSLHKALPSTTSYYKACRKHFPVLLCTTKLAENTSQYYFVLQCSHKPLPSTTSYYKACTKHSPVLLWYYKACRKHVPVLLCTTKLAENTSQYYFVLQSLHFKWHTPLGTRRLHSQHATRSGIRHSQVAYAT